MAVGTTFLNAQTYLLFPTTTRLSLTPKTLQRLIKNNKSSLEKLMNLSIPFI